MKSQIRWITQSKLLLFMLVFFTADSYGQLSGTKTIPGDYATVAAAVTALNGAGVGAGGVTFNVAAGYTESITAPITITATGTIADQIIFQKSGAGANPKITRTDGGSNTTSSIGGLGDMIISISTGDYISFDAIDVEASSSGIEYGYFLTKTATDACKNVTIKNASITMTKGTSAYVIGIYVSNAPSSVSSATGVTVTSTGGRSESITITGNTISNVFSGVYLRGYSAAAYYDINNTIGDVGAGNTIQNFAGNATGTAYGVYGIYQNTLSIQYNTINNMSGGGSAATGTLYGVFNSTATGAPSNFLYNNINLTTVSSTTYGVNNAATGNVIMDNNTLSLNSTGSGSGTFGFLYNSGGSAATTNSFSNNTIAASSYTTTGSSYLIYNSVTNAATQDIHDNSTSGTITKLGSSGAFYGYYNLGSPTGIENIYNNTLSNIDVSAGSGTTYIIYTNTTAAHTQNIYDNTINNISGGSGTLMGINATAAGIRTIYDNTIYSISGSGSVTGITNGTGATSSDVYNNKIYDLSSTTTSTATVYGISATTIQANLNIYNNLIGNLTASTANPGGTTDAIRGLSITGTTANTNVNISFNTIYINASSSGTNFSASGIYHTYNATGSTASLTMRNNIIYNNSTASGTGIISAFRRSAATDLNNYNTASNNNLFYAGTPSATNLIFYDGTSSYSVLASFKAVVTPREANSIRENPAFVSTTGSNVNFLHINTATPTLIESGGTTVTGITTDFDGNARNVATPDIGADEFAGTPAVAMVYASSDAVQQTGTAYPTTNQTILRMVVNTTGSASPLNISSFTLNANGITNIADVTTAKVYYTGASTVFDASVLFGTNTPTVANYTITGSQDLVEGSNYFWLVYDVTTTALNGNLVDAELVDLTVSSTVYTPSTSAPAGSKMIAAPLDGNYNVGAGQVSPNYTTVTAAINDLNARGVKNNVTFTLLNNTSTPYDAANGETFPIVINEISGASPTQTITIKPGAGVTSIISGSVNSNSLIKLSGSDYITIDGSNSGGNDRSLTITNTGTTTPTAVSIASLGTGLGAVNNTIKNCNLNTSATSTAYGVSVGGNPGVSGADNDNVTIQNNYINGVSRGIYAIGTAAGLLDNLQINQNTIDINTTTSTIGIQTGQATSSSVSNNTLTVETSTSTDPVGISIETGFVSSVINSNNIKKVKCTYAISQYGGRGITIGTASATSALTVANNSISGVSGVTNFSAFSYSSVGIFLGTIGASSTITTVAGGIDLYFNSVNMSGDFAGYNTAATLTAALYVGSNASALNVRDNVFVNSLNNLHGTYGATSKSYAIYSVAPLASYTTIDYNDYYVSGAQGVLGYIGSARADLPAIQAGFGSNAASITADPLFNTAIVLAPLSGSPLLSAGENPNTTGITTDLVNTARGATPTIGAYEAAGDVAGPEITYTALLNATSGANRTLAVTITDLSGIAGGANQPLIYYRKGNSGVYFSAPATTVVAPTYTFTIDHSNVGGLSSGEKIQYYVAAQDALANISTSPDGGSGATPPGTTAPSSPNEYAFPITYVWQGGSSDFQSAANWSPTRTSLDANDILVFDGAVTAAPTVSNIPSQTITKLRFINNVNATLDGAASASLTINGDAATDNLDIAAGSTATLGQTSSLGILFTNVGQQGNVAGTLAMHSGTINFTNATTTFTSTGVFSINGTAGQTSTATNLSFATGASVLFNKTSGTIPTATYDLNSNITVSGITTGTGLSWPASIGGLTWNCPAQTSNFSIASSVTTINGDINIINTNTGTFQTGVSVQTLNVNGNAALSGGTWNVSGNNLAMTGTFTQSGGT